MMMHNFYAGTHVIASDFLVDTVWVQFRFPRSKKKRIRKKWAKDRKNWRSRSEPWNKFFVLQDGTIAAHPAMLGELRKAIEAVDRDTIQRIMGSEPNPFQFQSMPPPFVTSRSTNTVDAMKQIVQRLGLPARIILDAKPTYYVDHARLSSSFC